MKKLFFSLAMLLSASAFASTQKLTVEITNPYSYKKVDTPIKITLNNVPFKVSQAIVTIDGKEIPSQLDDLTGDGTNDFLCFLVDIDQKQTLKAEITYSDTEKQKDYPARTYSSLIMRSSKIKEPNKHNLFMKELLVPGDVSFYSQVHQHGSVIESELIAFRIYFDHRQTLDLYGKKMKRLELKDTQFYPDAEQKAANYGDDILWAGNTLGAGAIRGFNGTEPVMLENLDYRGQRIISAGPVRAIIEVVNQNWIPAPGQEPVTMKTFYTVYGGHRDCEVTCTFDRATKNTYCTGIINIPGSKEYTDSKGLRACWGSNWTVAAKDTLGHEKETLGMAIYVPKEYIKKELPTNADNLAFAISSKTNSLTYNLAFAYDRETFADIHSSDVWFDWTKNWRKELDEPVEVKIIE